MLYNVIHSLKKCIVIFLILLFSFFKKEGEVFSQNIAINTTGASGNTSALLDLNTGNTFTSPNGKGLLIPNVSLTTTADVTTIASAAHSLLVYNTNAGITGTGAAGKGYYYWDNVALLWINLIDQNTPGAAWMTLGNANTVNGTNFIGTTDNVPLSIRVNNQKAGRLDNTLNTAFWGYQAGNVNTAADNTFIGSLAGDANTSGTANTFLGKDAGGANITTSNNTFLGYRAGFVNTATDNTFIGKSAGDANTSGTTNTFIGIDAGNVNTTGSGHTFVGYQSGNTFAGFAGPNTFLGYQAGYNVLGTLGAGGYNNTYVGYQAGFSTAETGFFESYENTFIGDKAGYSNQKRYNVYIGSSAAYLNLCGERNVVIGSFAGQNLTCSSNNVIIGEQAGMSQSIGSNVYIGWHSARVSTGAGNAFLGYGTGEVNTTGSSNTFIGTLAGQTNIFANANVTGANNTFVGYNSGPASPTQRTNAGAIGYNAQVDANNALVLGGTGVDAVNVGIGLTNPVYTLDITSTTARGVNVTTTGTTGIYATASGASAIGLDARITSNTGESRGISVLNSTITSTNWQYGVKSVFNGAMTGNSSFAVYGQGNGTSNSNYAGYFTTSSSPSGTATVGSALNNYAGYFRANSTTGTNYGVYISAGDLVASYGTIAAGAAITIPASTTVVRITDDAAVAANAITMPAGVDGKVLYIHNNDAQVLSGGTTVPSGQMWNYIYSGGVWVRVQ